ncbi:DNA mismatch repair protein MLH3 [Phytophthora citrophthora]|uniref:DNA mismatch repair protein MLH3 n=1 Tax=Phytophthora citrophthora TaxID=4793 RepID=A0AAD9G628_9STRA|nr:DNA mismatch repair protein MLH3 [Phytophthora citrophthora]
MSRETATCTPWLSSKPDTYDFADIMLGMYDDNYCNSDENREIPPSTGKVEDSTERGLDQYVDAEPRLGLTVRSPVRSQFFTSERPSNSTLQRWAHFKDSRVKHLAAGLQIDNVQLWKGDREMKISRSVLANLQVIRQVDRKFILVQAATPQGTVVLCIDQHAADERVRLEKLEEEVFGRDGTLRRVEVEHHEPAFVLRMNFTESQVLNQYEDLIRSWGFDFEFMTSEPKKMMFNCQESRYKGERRVLLHSTPKVEKRVTNVDDFRDFIQLLARLGETHPHSHIRPPVITRLLHSRACRSAIMFGDRLSLAQCQDLIEELKTCQLTFQCAHGRPSVVPLAEIRNKDH